MHLKGVFFVLFFSFHLFLFSQQKLQKPDFKRIKKEIKKKKSKFYYPHLVKKYTRGISMTPKEKQYFYYGFAFFKSYKPYSLYKFNQQINSIISSKNYSKKNLYKLLDYINLDLAIHPFDLKLLKIKLFVYKRLRDSTNFKIVQHQIKVIKDAILSSGNGLSEDTDYAVIFEKNQYDVLEFLKLKGIRKKYFNKNTEIIDVSKNGNNIKQIYFDVSLLTRRINVKKK